MIKRFCDICGQEVKEDVRRLRPAKTSNYASGLGTKLSLEIIVVKDGKANDGDFCRYCIIDAMNSLDDRKQEVKA